MTTLLLANKLMTMKLDKSEFEKIKYSKVKNLQESHKAVFTLRKIIGDHASEKSCRLCLKSGEKHIFDDRLDFDILTGIRNILGIEILENDGKPQYICVSCESTIKATIQLKETADVTQWRLQQELDMLTESNQESNADVWDKIHGGYFNVKGKDFVRDWTCGKCQRVFQTQEEFREHELLPSCRTISRSYICETCGSEFKSMSQLKRHRLIHTGELLYGCEQCSYRARTKYALSVHVRLHSGERPVRCSLCPASFPNASNLASHRRTHLPPRYRCDVCQRAFRFNEALLNHIATQHRSAKPFNCNLCGKSFATRKMIRRHELKTHNRPKLRPGVTPIYMRQQEGDT